MMRIVLWIIACSLKAHTHTPTFAGSLLESANSSPESADSTTDFMTVGRLPVLNMFNIQSADFGRLTIAIGQLQIGLVDMGL